MIGLGSPGLFAGNSNAGGVSPSGVLLRFPTGQQSTSFRTGDEAWRLANGFFDPLSVPNPAGIANLDYSLGTNYWFQLLNPLSVGGNSNTFRFVDVDGLQAWGATGNKNLITIDKLTGLGITRDWFILPNSNFDWPDTIDSALSYSIVVGGITYDNWYVWSLEEALLMFGQYFYRDVNFLDPITGEIILIEDSVSGSWTSTTVPAITTRAYVYEAPVSGIRINSGFEKTITGFARTPFIFDARSLISAP